MCKAFKGLYIGAAAAFFVFSQPAVAGYEEMQVKNLDKRVTELEHKKGNGGVINPSVNPMVKDGVDLFIAADFLWMTAREDGLTYGEIVSSDPSDSSEVNFNSIDTNKNWKPGFRVALGYYMTHDDWDIQLDWLRMHGNRQDSETTLGDNVPAGGLDYIVPQFGMFAPDSFGCASASSTWKANIDLVDLEIGRNFYVSKNLSLRPFFSVRGLAVNQKLDNTYENLISETELSDFTEQVNLKDDYSAFGPRIGLNGEWMFADNFSLYGNAAIAGVYGKIKVEENSWQFDETDSEELPIAGSQRNHKDDYFSGKAVSDLALGLRWSTKFKDDRYGLSINLAWEHHCFFNFNNFPVWEDVDSTYPIDIKSHGDLTLQGISLGLKFDF